MTITTPALPATTPAPAVTATPTATTPAPARTSARTGAPANTPTATPAPAPADAPGPRPRPVRRPGGPGTGPAGRRDTRRPGPGGPGGPGTRPGTRPGARPRVPALPGDAQRQPHRWFADRLLDILTGRHPVSRMLGHTTGPHAYDRLWDLSVSGVLHPPAGSPLPRVRRCGFRSPVPQVREAWALIASGDALRALAFRLEHGPDQRWRCAAVDFAGPGW